MSTRYFKNKNDSVSRSAGYEGANIPEDFNVPSCTIEDVDRALFNLFDKDLSFTYKHKEGTKRAPVIFASGERFAVLRRKEPLRDKSGALVLPLVSIMRTGISQTPEMGAGTAQNSPMIVKRRLSKEDPTYQRLLNKKGFKNSDDLPSKSSLDDVENNPDSKGKPGRNASRREIPTRKELDDLGNSLGNNVFEIIEIPPPKYFTATYEITFWAQYTLQMNDMITALMSLYQSYSQRTFQLETEKGYWFVGYGGESLSPGNNFDDFTDSERIVRYTFEMKVPGYLVNPSFPGSQNGVRRYVSAPEISFEAVISEASFEVPVTSGIVSNDPADYVLEDTRTIDDPLPGQKIGGTNFAASDSRGIFRKRQGSQLAQSGRSTESIGGTMSDDNRTIIIEFDRDPFTGKKIRKSLHVKNRTNRKGETVLRETLD